MKRILINATQAEELRVALVDGQRLYDLDIETTHIQKKKANIYKGIITRIEPSLEAAFVDYGAERHGFLPFKELSEEFHAKFQPENGERASISDLLSEGQEILIQVQKEERGNKGAALTTQIALAGPYIVMMPNTANSGGISRRVEGEDRSDIRQLMSELNVPDGMSTIIRTAGVGKSAEELQWGVDYLAMVWSAICQATSTRPAPFLVYQESDIVIRALRDHLRNDVGEILIDHQATWQKARDFVQQVMPSQVDKIIHYNDRIPLFNRFQIESQIESAFQREVVLPSGGVIVIDNTEALTAIDINSGRSTKGGDIEETAFHTNMEAAEEIARQLRLRDLGGLVVIDFIDMNASKHQREVEQCLKEASKADRARIQIGRISRFGLLELSRQRLRPSLEESTQHVCPRCRGLGVIRGVESIALSILRQIEETAIKDHTHRIMAQMPVDVATFLLNEKRDEILRIESRHRIHIMLIPNEHLETPHYTIERYKANDGLEHRYSYEAKSGPEVSTDFLEREQQAQIEVPAVSHLPTQAAPAPIATSNHKDSPTSDSGGWLKRMWSSLFGQKETEEKTTEQQKPQQNKRRSREDMRKDRAAKRRQNRQQADSATPDDNTQQMDHKANEATSSERPQRRRERPQRRERTPRHEQNASIDQIADKTQAEIQSYSRAAMDRINAKADNEILTAQQITAPAVATELAKPAVRTPRQERMARSDRWERQLALDPVIDPALQAAQDAAADSLMGNRNHRQVASNADKQATATTESKPTQQSSPTVEKTATTAAAPTAENTATASTTEFVVSSTQIEATQVVATEAVADSVTEPVTSATNEKAMDNAANEHNLNEENSENHKREYNDRRGRRSPYRRRAPRRPSQARREHNGENALELGENLANNEQKQ